jgi:hypothetical protein
VDEILNDGCRKAIKESDLTIARVRAAMQLME